MKQKAFQFFSLGRYRPFCDAWWNDGLAYWTGLDFSGRQHILEIDARRVEWHRPRWCHDIYTYWHRARYGWAPQDTWDLDNYLDTVIGHSVIHLSNHTHSAPTGYPRLMNLPLDGDWSPVTDYDWSPVTDYDQWRADLLRWGTACAMASAALEDEDASAAARTKALEEMLPWWDSLWD